MKPLAIFLQAGSRLTKNNYIKLFSRSANPTISGLTTAGEIVVLTTLDGVKHRETYPAGTTSIAFSSDANEEIIVIGDISSVNASASISFQQIEVKSDILTSFKIVGMGGYGYNINKVYIHDCPQLATLELRDCAYLSTLKIENCALLSSTNFSSSTAIRSVVLKNTPTLTSISFYSAVIENIEFIGSVGLTSLALGSSVLTAIDLSELNALKTLTLTNCTSLKSLRFAEYSTVETISMSNCTVLDSFVGVGLLALKSLTLSSCPSLSHLDVSMCAALETLSITQAPLLKELSLLNNVSLKDLICTRCPLLTSLAIRQDDTLKNLQLNLVGVQTIDLSNYTGLHNVVLRDLSAQVTGIDSLTEVTYLGLSNIDSIESIAINSSTFDTIAISGLVNLEKLWITGAEHYEGSVSGIQKINNIKCRLNDEDLATNIANAITNSTAADGVVYINSSDTFKSLVSAAATAKGWTIEAL